MPAVSIIIPVYNVERYLKECLDSVLAQTLREIEIICVDDGSTDLSGMILDEYASKDKRLKVFHNQNHGYGYSMNFGMQKANGKYIGIVESDDKIAPNMYETLYHCMEKTGVDVVKSDFYHYYHNKWGAEIQEYTKLTPKSHFYNRMIKPDVEPDILFLVKYTWTGLYRTDYIREKEIKHNETPGASYQDNGFWFQTIVMADSIYILEEAFYSYRIDNPDSSIHSKGKVFAVCDEFDFIRERLNGMGDEGRIFIPYMHYFRLLDCMGNLKRVSEEYRLQLALRVQSDYLEAVHNHELDESVFNSVSADRMFRLASCPAQFCEKHIQFYQGVKKQLEVYDEIIIYGAGLMGEYVFTKLSYYGLRDRILCFAVTHRNNTVSVKGIQLKEINEVKDHKDKALVIIAVSQKYCSEVMQQTQELEFSNFIMVNELFPEEYEYYIV